MKRNLSGIQDYAVWLFWFYVELGKEARRKVIITIGFFAVLLSYFAYGSLVGEWSALPWTDTKRWSPLAMAVLFLPPATLVLYGFFFGARHQLEKLDPAYTTPSPLAPLAFAAMMIFIALSKYLEWW